ncbi:MAG: acetolactate decarboxylase [Bacteroidales bacterium]|nr:acetolactate decarboxylase [Candidatus Sodaliphilus fimicaballi]
MKRIIKPLSFIAALVFTMSVSSCDKNEVITQHSTVNPESMYQVATLQSLMVGNYDGFVSVGELREFGDIGLGTFDAVDGEMIVLDGNVYQARYDGSVKIADDKLGVPFASVTKFDCDSTVTFNSVASLEDLTKQLTAIVEKKGKNLIYAVRIDVDNCDSVLVRSELPQNKPYKPLAEALATDQREFTYPNISGTIVAVYFPSFFTAQNTPGWHCHFISADRTKGGHMLNFVTNKAMKVQLDATPYFNMYMPENADFANRDLSKDLSSDIEKVEK